MMKISCDRRLLTLLGFLFFNNISRTQPLTMERGSENILKRKVKDHRSTVTEEYYGKPSIPSTSAIKQTNNHNTLAVRKMNIISKPSNVNNQDFRPENFLNIKDYKWSTYQNGDDERFHESGRPCAVTLWCTCFSDYSVICANGGKSLSYIPQLPENTTTFYFYSNFLREMNETTFLNLTSLRLRKINLQNNSLRVCKPSIFSKLLSLETLSIVDETIEPEELQTCFMGFSATSPLKTLNLVGIHTVFLPNTLFVGLANTSVEKVYIRRMPMDIFDQRVMSPIPKLKYIVMNFCQIKETYLQGTNSIEKINLNFNKLSQFPGFCYHGFSLYPNLTTLLLMSNEIDTLFPADVECMKKVRYFSISNNPLTMIRNNTFAGLINLKSLYINGIQDRISIEPLAFNSSSLTHLFFSNNLQIIEWRQLDRRLFSHCFNLEHLDISQNTLDFLSEQDFNDFFGPLKKLKSLILKNTGITFLPIVVSRHLIQLQFLSVSRNNIIGWPDGYFQLLKSLEIIDLSYNKISFVNRTSLTLSQIDRIHTINLSNNPYSCSCELLWFINLIKSHKNDKKLTDPKAYVCNTPLHVQNQPLIQNPLSTRDCILTSETAMLIVIVSSIALVTFFLGSMGYRYRWYIKYAAYMLHFQKRRRERCTIGACGYKYDVYLSCSELDMDVLLENAIPTLEEEEGLDVYIPHRDGIGHTMNEIVTNIEASRKTILFLSDHYAQDYFCEFEASLAFDKYLHEKTNSLIIILLHELSTLKLSRALYKMVKTGDYITWCPAGVENELCWYKIKTALRNRDDLRP